MGFLPRKGLGKGVSRGEIRIRNGKRQRLPGEKRRTERTSQNRFPKATSL